MDNNFTNIPLHIGLKTYTSTGANALNTLRDLGWDITEQYQAQYQAGSNTTLSGTTLQKPLDSGAITSAVTAIPSSRCSFTQWSDGITANPRTDTVTDNLTVTALASCAPPPSTSATRQIQNLEAIGKTEEAAALCKQFPNACPSATAVSTSISATGSSTHVLIELVKPEYRAIMAALLRAFGW